MDVPFSTSFEFTRPANANQYTIKDVVGESVAKIMKFPDITPDVGFGFWILSPKLVSNNPAATLGSFILLLFNAPVTVPADHAVFAPNISELGTFIGAVVFDNGIKVSTGVIYVPTNFSPIYGIVRSDSKGIYGVLLDNIAYTPASTEVFRSILSGVWDCPEGHRRY